VSRNRADRPPADRGRARVLRRGATGATASVVVAGLVAVAGSGAPALGDLDGPAVRIERRVARLSYGVDRPAATETSARCAALTPVLQRRAGRYRLPRGGPVRELLLYLDSRESPARAGSAFARSTATPVAAMRRHLRRDGPPLGPAALLERCLDAAGGDVPLGILTCHNVLKEVALEGRASAPGAASEDSARIAARLEPWRRNPRTPDGEHDKLGPLYHLFATMTAGVWGGTPWLGRLVEWGEAGRRIAGLGRDRPDPEKGEADRCGANAAFLVWRLERRDRRYPFRRRRRRRPSSRDRGHPHALDEGPDVAEDEVGALGRAHAEPDVGEPLAEAVPSGAVVAGGVRLQHRGEARRMAGASTEAHPRS